MKSRRERRKEAREQGKKFQPQPGVPLMGANELTPSQIAAMTHEINQQCLSAENL